MGKKRWDGLGTAPTAGLGGWPIFASYRRRSGDNFGEGHRDVRNTKGDVYDHINSRLGQVSYKCGEHDVRAGRELDSLLRKGVILVRAQAGYWHRRALGKSIQSQLSYHQLYTAGTTNPSSKHDTPSTTSSRSTSVLFGQKQHCNHLKTILPHCISNVLSSFLLRSCWSTYCFMRHWRSP